MTIRHLKIFVTVVECGTMRLAANQLYISQPSITQAIHELEKQYEVKLFDRINQRLYLTDQGNKLYRNAKLVIDSFDSLDLVMKNSTDYSKIRIGASVSIGSSVLNDYINYLEEKINNIEVNVVVNNTMTIENLIMQCKLDIGIVEGVVIEEDLTKIPLFDDELVIIVGNKHPFFNESKITINQLNNQPFISREINSVERNQFENFLIEEQIVVKRSWICSNIEAIKKAVINGRGLAIVSKLTIKDELNNKSLKILPIENFNMVRKIQLIYHKDKYITESMRHLIDICSNI